MIYIDSDGVLAAWCGYVFNKHLPHLSREELNTMCPVRRKGILADIYLREPNLFANLSPIEGAKEFVDWLIYTGEPFAVLTSAAADHFDFDIVEECKLQFFDKYFGLVAHKVIVVETSSSKASYADPGDLLIDDFGRNCREWAEKGGIAIRVETDKPNFEELKEKVELYLENMLNLEDNIIIV